MKKTLIALAGVAALIACGSSSSSSTTQTQAQAVTGLCQALTTNCAGTDDQLEAGEDESACEDKMQKTTTTGGTARDAYDFPLTDPNGTGDDLTCRENEAKLAASDSANKSAHCLNAGPTGGDKCGSLCDVYCDLEVRHCQNPAAASTVTNPGLSDVDHATCVAACNAEIGKGSATHFTKGGKVNDTSGDTLQCRIWHLGKAQANPSPHCFHTRLISATNAAGATPGPCS